VKRRVEPESVTVETTTFQSGDARNVARSVATHETFGPYRGEEEKYRKRAGQGKYQQAVDQHFLSGQKLKLVR